MSKVNYRPPNLYDLSDIMDIDLKSYEYPFTLAEWRTHVSSNINFMLLATVAKQPVGFILWSKEGDTGSIQRLAVMPRHRHQGIAAQLLRTAEAGSERLTDTNRMEFIVPAIFCVPGQADDMSQWLLAKHYLAKGPSIPEYCRMYGKFIEGYRFVKELNVDE